MTALPGVIRVGCRIVAVEFFVSGASHAQPAVLSTKENSSSRAEGNNMATRGDGTGDRVFTVNSGKQHQVQRVASPSHRAKYYGSVGGGKE